MPGAFVYNPASSSVLTVGTKTLSVIFNPSNSTDYNGASTNVNLTVSPTPLTVTASNASRPYGTANPSFTGTISGVVNGDNITATFSCSAASNSPVGNYTITSTLNDPNDRQTNYAVTLNNGALTIVVATPVVTWPAPAPILYGAALGPSQLNASANAAGNFAYTPPPGTVLNNIGTYPLDVVFTPADTTDYKSAEGSVNLTVSPAPLTVTASNASQSTASRRPCLAGRSGRDQWRQHHRRLQRGQRQSARRVFHRPQPGRSEPPADQLRRHIEQWHADREPRSHCAEYSASQ